MTGQAEHPDPAAFAGLSYLVIDDFDNFRNAMFQILRNCGAEKIELVASAKAAVHYCTYNHVDVVLCDYNLGAGKNGQQILEELRYRKLLKRSSLFLMVTAETSRDMVMGARENLPDGYLTKPINQAIVEKRLGNLIEQRRALLPINQAIDQENYPEAITRSLQALTLHPRYSTWLMKTLGDLYFRVGDLSHAIRIYDDVLSRRELPWARLGRSRILLAQQHYDTAIADLEQLIAANPDFMEAYDLLAEGLKHQGLTSRAQDLLLQAVSRSPHAIVRQKQLARLAEINQDPATAADAWRQVVAQGKNSIHDCSQHHLAFAQSLAELCDSAGNAEATTLASEALSVLSRMEKRFAGEPELGLRSLLAQCRVHAGAGQIQTAEELLNSVRGELEHPDTMTPDTGLDFARTLFRLGDHETAKKLLATLAELHSDKAEVLEAIENLLDEPVGFREKLQARSLNQSGIAAFEQGDLEDAAKAFRDALAVVPDHKALNLNLVQVLLKAYQQSPDKHTLLQECQGCMSRLADIPRHHRQYRRYIALQNRLKDVMP